MIQIIIHLNNLEFETSLKYASEVEHDSIAEMNILCKPELMQTDHKQ